MLGTCYWRLHVPFEVAQAFPVFSFWSLAISACSIRLQAIKTGTIETGAQEGLGTRLCLMLHVLCTLVPKPFLLPVFDRLQYAKTEAEGLGESRSWRQVNVRVDVRGAVPDEESWGPSCNILSKKLETVTFERQHQYSLLFGKPKADQCKVVIYNDRAPPPSRLPDVTHVTLSPRLSPSVFAYCKQSKTGGGNGLGTRLCLMYKHQHRSADDVLDKSSKAKLMSPIMKMMIILWTQTH